MPAIAAIYTSPVKSLALRQLDSVELGPAGIANDRRFHLIDGGGRLLTQRQRPKLVQVSADYDSEQSLLRFEFPDGNRFEDTVSLGEPVITQVWGRQVPGRVADGPWNEALSRLCRGPVRLVMTDQGGQSFDEYPVSLVSQGSIDLLDQRTGGAVAFEGKRFRPNLLLADCQPHEEDFWLGGVISIGASVRLRVQAPDGRCAVTAVNPETGERDFDTPRFLLTYRPAARAPYFGVYAAVAATGTISVGDVVEVSEPSPYLR